MSAFAFKGHDNDQYANLERPIAGDDNNTLFSLNMTSSNPNLGKSLSIPSNYTPSVPSGTATSSFEFSRRPTQNNPSPSQAVPRKGQGSRKQHRNQRRPGFAGSNSNGYLDDHDAMAEIRAVRNPSSRRGQTSITHLLDYTSSRPIYRDQTHHTRTYRSRPTWGVGSGYHAADKSRYVHANYRFIVSPKGDYSKHASDADEFLDWNDILQVIASSQSQAASCPICLSEPVAPRMAKCGHIFCLSCLIRFMQSHSDDDHKSGKGARWKKCPICEDIVYLHDVKPVRFYAGQESSLPRPGDDVVLRLMARGGSSTLALPREGGQEVSHSADEVPWYFAANVLDYARVMKGTGDYMAAQFDEEISALMQQEKEDELVFGLDNEWTQKAIKAVNTTKERLVSLGGADTASVSGKSRSKTSPGADFYFYSAPPHLYLSPLDIRILKAKYGDFSSFPSTLLPRVEHVRTGEAIDDVARKKAKYLNHLPKGCVVNFLECDWTDIVPSEILETFSADIEKRRKKNRDKAAQEERERLQAERIEAAELRATTGARRLMEPLEEDHVPHMDFSEFAPLSGATGTTPPEPRAGFSSLVSMSTSPSTSRTVWGTTAIPVSQEVPDIQEPVEDGWLREDDFVSTSDLAMQIQAIDNLEQEKEKEKEREGTGSGQKPPVGGGKKKKKQKITLMSTGGRRGQ